MTAAASSLLSLVFVAIGAGLIYYARQMSAKAQQSLAWPSTSGAIAHAAVLYQRRGAGDDESATYKADISYRYKVNGIDYSSARIAIVDFSASQARAQNVVARYPDGATVQVYYNPADHADAVLEPGSGAGNRLLYLIGAVFAVGGGFLLVMSLLGRVHTVP